MTTFMIVIITVGAILFMLGFLGRTDMRRRAKSVDYNAIAALEHAHPTDGLVVHSKESGAACWECVARVEGELRAEVAARIEAADIDPEAALDMATPEQLARLGEIAEALRHLVQEKTEPINHPLLGSIRTHANGAGRELDPLPPSPWFDMGSTPDDRQRMRLLDDASQVRVAASTLTRDGHNLSTTLASVPPGQHVHIRGDNNTLVVKGPIGAEARIIMTGANAYLTYPHGALDPTAHLTVEGDNSQITERQREGEWS